MITNPTNLAASTKEEVVSGTLSVDRYNSLIIQNGDSVKIRAYLDNDTTRFYDVEPKTALSVTPPDDEISFKTLVQENLDSATAQVAGKIVFIVAKEEV